MVQAILMKSIGDLKKRRARTFFTVLTIALGVAAMGMFAVVPLMDANMFRQMDRCNMYDVRCEVDDLNLTEEDFDGLSSIDNVKAVEGKYMMFTRMYIGERRADAFIVGVRDFSDQKVDKVITTSGSGPREMEALTDSSNARVGLYKGSEGGLVRLFDSLGRERTLNITGTAYNNDYSQWPGWGTVVLYTAIDTARELANGSGYIIMSFDLEDASGKEVDASLSRIESYLRNNTDFVSFASMPIVNKEGDWPGKDNFADMATFFYVLTFMTLGCSLFLISNTMHTMVSEQRREVCQMKAVGATRLQVMRTYLTTSLILGAAGSIAGTLLGVLVAYGMLYFLSSSFYGVTPAFAVHWATVLICLATGILVSVLASVPALVHAIRIPVREGMESAGISADFGSSPLDRLLMRSKALPRSFQMGFRNVSRKKGRSISTMLQIMLAVGMFLGVATVAYSLSETVRLEYDYFTYDIQAMGNTEGARAISMDAMDIVGSIEGVERVEPVIWVSGRVDGSDILLMGYTQDTRSYDLDRTICSGRWFTPEEGATGARVVVASKVLAKMNGKGINDTIDITTPLGVRSYTIVGLHKGQMMNGMNVFMPIPTIQDAFGSPFISGFAIMTENGTHSEIDRVASAVEDRMLEEGYVVSSAVLYVLKEQNVRSNQDITNLMLAVGVLIVLITAIGLMSTLTMNVIERTKEIGMLRCLGSRSWTIWKVFTSEGMTLAVFGALLGIPAGLGVGLFIDRMITNILHFELYYEFPLGYVLFAFVMTLVLTLIVIQLPLRRAVNLRPGDALRYQ